MSITLQRTVMVSFTNVMLADLLCTMFESDLSWFRIVGNRSPDTRPDLESEAYPYYATNPLGPCGCVMLTTDDDEPGTVYTLDHGTLRWGLQQLLYLHPVALDRIIEGQYDAKDADLLLQYAIFGELRYS